MDDFEKFHLRKTQRRPLADLSALVNKPGLHKNQKSLRPHKRNNITKESTQNTTRSTPTVPIGRILLLTKSLHGRPPSCGKSAFSTKSLLFDTPPTKGPKFEPRYRNITENVIKPLKDTNELTRQSNVSVRAFTEWYRLQDYLFVAKEGNTNGNREAIASVANSGELLPQTPHKRSRFVLYTVVEAHRIGLYLLTARLSCTKVHEHAHSGNVLLMSPDSRIEPRQNDKILLSEQGKFNTSISGTPLPTYTIWKIAKMP